MNLPIALLCPVLGLGLLIVIVVRLIASFQKSSSMRRPGYGPSARLTTSMAEDGFWVSGDQVDLSSVIQYAYWSGTVQKTGTVPFQPGADGRQFIYTGAKPDRLSAVLLADATSPQPESDLTIPPFIPPVETPFSSHGGFPSAY